MYLYNVYGYSICYNCFHDPCSIYLFNNSMELGYQLKAVNDANFCTEGTSFTDSKNLILGCPNGGNLIDNYNMCISQNTVPDETNNCPNGYTRVKNYCS